MTIETMIDVAGQLATGFAPGLITSIAYFAGLALGVRAACAARYSMLVLLASFGARLMLLLGMAFWVAQFGVYATAGFATAFIVVRIVALRIITKQTVTTTGRQSLRQGGLDAADTR